MFKSVYRVEQSDVGSNVSNVLRKDYQIGQLEQSEDGFRCFGVNDAGSYYYIGHTVSRDAAVRLIEKAFANITHYCNLKGGK